MEREDNQRREHAQAEAILAAFRSQDWGTQRDWSHWGLATIVVAGLLALVWYGLEPMNATSTAADPGVEEVVVETVSRPASVSVALPLPTAQDL